MKIWRAVRGAQQDFPSRLVDQIGCKKFSIIKPCPHAASRCSNNHISIICIQIKRRYRSKLFQISLAGGHETSLPRPTQCWQKKCTEDCNDCNHNKKLYQCEKFSGMLDSRKHTFSLSFHVDSLFRNPGSNRILLCFDVP